MGVYRKRIKTATGEYVLGDTWWIDYQYQGTRYRQKIGTRKKDAEEALSKIKVKIAAGEFIPPEERKREEAFQRQPVLFETFALEEFLPWSQGQHSANHYIRLQYALNTRLIPYFGKRPLHEITTKLIEDYKIARLRGHYKRGRQSKPVNPATVNRELCCLKVLFRKAVEWDKIDTSPARGVRAFKETPRPPVLLEQEEVARLLEELPDHFCALAACAVYAGLRKSELFHLHWEDINWKVGELNVVSREEHHTKNYESRRVPMNDELVKALRHHLQRLGGKLPDSPYVFANREGKPYKNIRESLNQAAKKAGIKGSVKMHQLRHAFCSHAFMQGIDARTIQRWMGHRDLRTTLRYAHISPDHEKAAIQRLQYKSSHPAVTKAGNGQ
jgi:integrase